MKNHRVKWLKIWLALFSTAIAICNCSTKFGSFSQKLYEVPNQTANVWPWRLCILMKTISQRSFRLSSLTGKTAKLDNKINNTAL